MKIAETKRLLPRESDFLFWLFMLIPGAHTAATGTFSKVTMGTWGGPEVRLAGWLLLVVSLCGIFYCLQRLQSYERGHYFLITLFILSVITGAILPFISLRSHFRLLPIFWMLLLLLFGHLLHRAFVKILPDEQCVNQRVREEQGAASDSNKCVWKPSS